MNGNRMRENQRYSLVNPTKHNSIMLILPSKKIFQHRRSIAMLECTLTVIEKVLLTRTGFEPAHPKVSDPMAMN